MEVILKLCPNPEFQGLSLKETQALYKPGTAQLSTVLIQATATAVPSDMELLGGCRVPCPSINPGTHRLLAGIWLLPGQPGAHSLQRCLFAWQQQGKTQAKHL